MMRLVCASANPKKVAELARMLPEWVTLVPRPHNVGDVEETAPTIEGNAIIKGVEVANVALEWAIADDTGLEVSALNGAPGVCSARFAGDLADDAANRALLLQKLEGVTDRSAQFRTVIALVSPKGEIHLTQGTCIGHIALQEIGEGGFGYDSVFIPAEGDGRTFAQMDSHEKDAISHRGKAIAEIPELLSRMFGIEL